MGNIRKHEREECDAEFDISSDRNLQLIPFEVQELVYAAVPKKLMAVLPASTTRWAGGTGAGPALA